MEELSSINFFSFTEILLGLLHVDTRGRRIPPGAWCSRWSGGLNPVVNLRIKEIFSCTRSTAVSYYNLSPAPMGHKTSPSCKWTYFHPSLQLALFLLVWAEFMTLNFKVNTKWVGGYRENHFPHQGFFITASCPSHQLLLASRLHALILYEVRKSLRNCHFHFLPKAKHFLQGKHTLQLNYKWGLVFLRGTNRRHSPYC